MNCNKIFPVPYLKLTYSEKLNPRPKILTTGNLNISIELPGIPQPLTLLHKPGLSVLHPLPELSLQHIASIQEFHAAIPVTEPILKIPTIHNPILHKSNLALARKLPINNSSIIDNLLLIT